MVAKRTAKSKTRRSIVQGKSPAAKREIARKAGLQKTAARAAASRTERNRTTPKSSGLATAAALVRGAATGVLSAVTGHLPWSKDENDPFVLLEADHRRFEDLLAQGVKTTQRAAKRRTQLLTTLAAELNVHELLEEKILYPALRSHKETAAIVLEGYEEHHVADVVLEELRVLATGHEKWGAKFKVLKESLEHHIEEEESRMFRLARGVLDARARKSMAARMKALKCDLIG
jgi:hypothetical protein